MARMRVGLLVVMLFTNAYALDDTAIKVKWGYQGNIAPARWGQLNPDFAFCQLGRAQSPIDIKNNIVPAENTLKINYQAAPYSIIDDGATMLQLGNQQVMVNTGHSVQLNFPASAHETISLNGKTYQLIQLHVHSPSENLVRGRAFPLEIHFVHQGGGGEVVVIGVFANEADAHPVMQQIVDHIPKTSGQEVSVQDANINPYDLLPAVKEYVSFPGSLTTPPCNEGVTWVVMLKPILVSSAQVVKLRQAAGGVNARPVQSLNKRQLLFSKVD